ncbi:MAG: hypothetical protein LBE09_05485, partial [Christensenellaceae bacterium]|nr:hypothetical protein [Christensenellaceae bacterium]
VVFGIGTLTLVLATLFLEYTPNNIRPIALNAMQIPYKIQNEVGLFDLEAESSNSDEKKPLMVFFPGDSQHEIYAIPWLEAGFRVLCVKWDSLLDDTGNTDHAIFQANRVGVKLKTSTSILKVADVSITAIMSAFYLETMRSYIDSVTDEIAFVGLGNGATLALAVASYVAQYESLGEVDTRVIPDRVTLIDYNLTQTTGDVPWLQARDADIGDILGALLSRRGIALEIVEQSDSSIDDGIYKHAQTLRTPDSKSCLTYAMYPFTPTYDISMYNTHEYAVSRYTPTSYVLGRRGVIYNYVDTASANSMNVENPRIAGIVFLDANNNGIYDERIWQRIQGVKIEIYNRWGLIDVLLASGYTDESGFYSFGLKAGYGNSFDKIFVKIYAPEYYGITSLIEYDQMFASAIDASGVSKMFELEHRKALKIINVGLIENAHT